jgi:hypothetical protein
MESTRLVCANWIDFVSLRRRLSVQSIINLLVPHEQTTGHHLDVARAHSLSLLLLSSCVRLLQRLSHHSLSLRPSSSSYTTTYYHPLSFALQDLLAPPRRWAPPPTPPPGPVRRRKSKTSRLPRACPPPIRVLLPGPSPNLPGISCTGAHTEAVARLSHTGSPAHTSGGRGRRQSVSGRSSGSSRDRDRQGQTGPDRGEPTWRPSTAAAAASHPENKQPWPGTGNGETASRHLPANQNVLQTSMIAIHWTATRHITVNSIISSSGRITNPRGTMSEVEEPAYMQESRHPKDSPNTTPPHHPPNSTEESHLPHQNEAPRLLQPTADITRPR